MLHILHSFLSQSELRKFFVYIIREITSIPDHFTRSMPPSLASRVNTSSYDPESCNKKKLSAIQATIQRLRAWFKLLLLIICRAFENQRQQWTLTLLQHGWLNYEQTHNSCGAVIGWKLLRNHSWSRLHCKSNIQKWNCFKSTSLLISMKTGIST